MISPYVRRLRLAQELIDLREKAGLSHQQLASKIGQSRAKISRLENSHIRPDMNDILRLLDVLQVDEETWHKINTIAREAGERGWWESTRQAMGERQAQIADLEAGAVTIREFYSPYVPGLMQTMAYTGAVVEHDDLGEPTNPDVMLRARADRQRMLRRPGGPSYELILDELVTRRPTVPPAVLAEQLHALANLASDRFTVRVLPMDAIIESFSVPKSAFSLYTYADPDDPTVVSVDTVTSDVVITEHDEAQRYITLYERLRTAALSPDDSAVLLVSAADQLEGLT